jgi:hypothetical protein
MAEASQPRPAPRRLPEQIKLPSKPVLKLKTMPHARGTK